jgi:hypothetical protein
MDIPFVYHAIGGEDNPDQRLRRDSAHVFLSPQHNEGFGIVDFGLNKEETQKLWEVVHQFYKARPKFDMNFDLKTDDALYCSEFVCKSLNRAMNDTAYIKATTCTRKNLCRYRRPFYKRPCAHGLEVEIYVIPLPPKIIISMKKVLRSVSVLVIAGILLVSCNKNSSKFVATTWLNDFYHADYEAAIPYSTDLTKKQLDQFSNLASYVTDSNKKELKKLVVTVKDVKEKGDTAIAT